jgi:hypothetical protein
VTVDTNPIDPSTDPYPTAPGLWGRVTNAAGQPVGGICLLPTAGLGQPDERPPARTNAGGWYQIPLTRVLPPGVTPAEVQADPAKQTLFFAGLDVWDCNPAPRYGDATNWTDLRPWGPIRLDFTLAAAPIVQGRVHDALGRTVPGVCVAVQDSVGSHHVPLHPDGTFTIQTRGAGYVPYVEPGCTTDSLGARPEQTDTPPLHPGLNRFDLIVVPRGDHIADSPQVWTNEPATTFGATVDAGEPTPSCLPGPAVRTTWRVLAFPRSFATDHAFRMVYSFGQGAVAVYLVTTAGAVLREVACTPASTASHPLVGPITVPPGATAYIQIASDGSSPGFGTLWEPRDNNVSTTF